jgi:hypothetical protein
MRGPSGLRYYPLLRRCCWLQTLILCKAPEHNHKKSNQKEGRAVQHKRQMQQTAHVRCTGRILSRQYQERVDATQTTAPQPHGA